MTGVTHRLAGISIGVIAIEMLQINDIKMQTLLVTGCIVGSLLPDIDNPRSKISYKLPLIRMIVGLFQKLIRTFAGILPTKQKEYVRSSIGHRGLTHSLMAAFLIPGIIYFFEKVLNWSNGEAAVGMMLGMLSHILLDLFSGGIRLLLPFSSENIKIMNVKTGGIIEWLVRIGIILSLIFFIQQSALLDKVVNSFFPDELPIQEDLTTQTLWWLW